MSMEVKSQRKMLLQVILVTAYIVFLGVSWMLDFQAGKTIGRNFFRFAKTMLLMFPAVFVLISLFEVWVKRELVEKHLGQQAGFRSYFWAILLAGAIVGPFYVALPVASTLYKKGAALGVIFTYLGASAVCRVPMTFFEASFLGLKFTAIRFIVSLPLIVLSSIVLERYLAASGHSIVTEA